MSDYTSAQQDYERSSQVEYGRYEPARSGQRASRPEYRTKRRPVGHNGMHRRRQKRWSW